VGRYNKDRRHYRWEKERVRIKKRLEYIKSPGFSGIYYSTLIKRWVVDCKIKRGYKIPVFKTLKGAMGALSRSPALRIVKCVRCDREVVEKSLVRFRGEDICTKCLNPPLMEMTLDRWFRYRYIEKDGYAHRLI